MISSSEIDVLKPGYGWFVSSPQGFQHLNPIWSWNQLLANKGGETEKQSAIGIRISGFVFAFHIKREAQQKKTR